MRLDRRDNMRPAQTGEPLRPDIARDFSISPPLMLNHTALPNACVAADRSRNVLVINGHPDPRPERFCAALCDAYVGGSRASHRTVRQLSAGQLLEFQPTQSRHDGDGLADGSEDILNLFAWARHLTIIFPLWLDRAPLQLQRLLRAAACRRRVPLARGSVADGMTQTVRIVITMEMPAFIHRSRIAARGFALPEIWVREPIFIGSVSLISDARRERWLEYMHALGATGT